MCTVSPTVCSRGLFTYELMCTYAVTYRAVVGYSWAELYSMCTCEVSSTVCGRG